MVFQKNTPKKSSKTRQYKNHKLYIYIFNTNNYSNIGKKVLRYKATLRSTFKTYLYLSKCNRLLFTSAYGHWL